MRRLIKGFTLTVLIGLFCISAFAGDGQFPQIYNTTLTVANTEYSQAVSGVKKIDIQCQSAHDVRIAFETGKVAVPTAPYFTIKSGTVYSEDDIIFNGTLYFGSTQAGAIVETIVYR